MPVSRNILFFQHSVILKVNDMSPPYGYNENLRVRRRAVKSIQYECDQSPYDYAG